MDQLYENGTIVTMDRPETAEAVLVREGRVAAVGRRADFATLGQVERVDLEGSTLLPGTAALLRDCRGEILPFEPPQTGLSRLRMPPGSILRLRAPEISESRKGALP